jgi:hypothetical protein
MQNMLIVILSLFSTRAFAHTGDHTSFNYVALIAHLSEPDHLAMIGLAAAAGFFAFRRYRVRAISKVQNHEPR